MYKYIDYCGFMQYLFDDQKLKINPINTPRMLPKKACVSLVLLLALFFCLPTKAQWRRLRKNQK